MVFSSLEFLFIFLPLFFIAYAFVPKKRRNLLIFAASIIFYAMGTLDKPIYILLIVMSVIVNFIIGLLIEYKPKIKKPIFIIGLIYDFFWLLLFKYADFFFSGINKLFEGIGVKPMLPMMNLLLPIGISFYTFQIVSYIADVYMGKHRAEKSLVNLGAYITMFPQLIAGPIVTYSDIKAQISDHPSTLEGIVNGIKTFVIGLGLKVMLANRIGALWTQCSTIGYESISTPMAWIGILAFTLQIYFDFYGYSLMAIGLGEIIGFKIPQNFDHPYLSRSMTEFWRRWHMTLGSWFREYVYIPLGGSREGKWKTYRNLMVVWLLTGFWHGASLNFVLWGLFLFAVIAIEKAGLLKITERIKPLGHLYMLLLIPISWTLFSITDFNQMGVFFSKLFPFFGSAGEALFEQDYIVYGKEYAVFLIIGVIFCTKIPLKIYEWIKNSIIGDFVIAAIFLGSFYCLYMGMNDPFLYFRF